MATPTTANRPSPEKIFNTLTAYQSSAALKAGIDLDIFTAIGDGAEQVKVIAERVKAAERGVRILCDYLTVQGFLTKRDGKYGLTQDAAIFLSRRSPAYMGGAAEFLTSGAHKQNYDLLTESVRKGGTAVEQGGDITQPHDELWISFARSMAGFTGVSAGFLADLMDTASGKPCKVLDVAAGHGMFGITIAKHNPNAQIVALDWPTVLKVAEENAQASGVANRVKLLAGSAFDADLGSGYDYILLTNILHHFDVATCEKLLRRMHAALKPGGKALTLEFIPNEDRVSPPMAASFPLVMLAGTDAGDAYTFSEYEKMFRNAGFAKTTFHPIPDLPQQALVSEKSS